MNALAHEDAFAALPELALDALDDGAERDAVLGHVRACVTCRRELDALVHAAAALGELAPPAARHADKIALMRGRLVERATSDKPRDARPRARASADPARPSSSSAGPRRWLAAAVLVLAVGSTGALLVVRERMTANARVTQLETRARQLEAANRELDRMVNERGAMLSALTGPRVAVVSLAASGATPPVARMFWDKATNRWTMFAHNLPPLAAGRTYQLWLITDGNERISAGTFNPSSSGDALVQATYALPPDALKMIAVTEEPAAGVAQPTGPVIISGTAE